MAAAWKVIGNETKEDRMLNGLFVILDRDKFLEIGKEKYILPHYYEKMGRSIDSFEVRDEDVFLTGHPKSGTTWLHEMVYLIMHDFNYEATTISTFYRLLLLEFSAIYNLEMLKSIGIDIPPLKIIQEAKSPRVIKSHLIWQLLPEQIQNGTKKPKIIHIRREPKDTCVSNYFHSKGVDGYTGNFDDYCKLFMKGRLIFGPFFENVKSFWRQRNRPRTLFLNYQELQNDLPGVIKRVANFLEKPITEDQVTELAQHLSFESMKKNRAPGIDAAVRTYKGVTGYETQAAPFFREGKVGNHLKHMSSEVIAEFDAWIAENIEGTDITF